uniref:Uncharacterized protein n=1 Tax=Cyanothece sp. (strain PCC 7425 / ATCC 29141) TaxID=395961 RepID=B8HTH2_CYAP4
MLYLAEVHKRTGFMGGNKAELKLLARQQSEQSWNAIPGEDMIPADSASEYSQGNLVLVELSANRQIQNIQEAGKQLVAILQNFSRMKEKFRTQEEEIEGWKQSLIYQSQELTRRELEMEARLEELQQMQSEVEQLEHLRQQVEQERQELVGLRDQLDRLQAEGGTLNTEQKHQIESLLNNLSHSLATAGSREELYSCLEQIHQLQQVLDYHWRQLEQQRNEVQQQQGDCDRQGGDLQAAWQQWENAQTQLEQQHIQMEVQRQSWQLLSDTAQQLRQQLQCLDMLDQQLATTIASGRPTAEVNMQTLMEMSLDDLRVTVASLQGDLQKMASFVQDQEEELNLQRQTVEELQAKIRQASEYERMSLEADLESENQSYQLLNDTLEGQRQRLRERQCVCEIHQDVLNYRLNPQGANPLQSEVLLRQLQHQRQQLAAQLQHLEGQVAEWQSGVQGREASLAQEKATQEQRHHELKQWDAHLQQQRLGIAQVWGRVNTYQEVLQPIQDHLNSLRQHLTGATDNHQPHPSEQTIASLKILLLSSS